MFMKYKSFRFVFCKFCGHTQPTNETGHIDFQGSKGFAREN